MLIRTNKTDPDRTAQRLIDLADQAMGMGPGWRCGGLSQPIQLQEGGRIGRILPGTGLSLDADLKTLGILKPLPNVFERTPVCKLFDLLANEDGAITSIDDIVAARLIGKANDITIVKSSFTTTANAWYTTFLTGGYPPAGGSYTAIAGGAVMTNAKAGALSRNLFNPTSPDKKYFTSFGFTCTQTLNFGVLADMLVAAGNINMNINTSQNVNTTALTRYTGGGGVMIVPVTVTQAGATGSFITFTYHNQANTAGQTTGAVAVSPAASIVGQTFVGTSRLFIGLQTGDWGVRSVETAQFSAATGNGTAAVDLSYPLMWVPGILGGSYIERDSNLNIDGITELAVDGSSVLGCLVLYVNTAAVTLGTLTVAMRTVSG